jgi:hypothetical protein
MDHFRLRGGGHGGFRGRGGGFKGVAGLGFLGACGIGQLIQKQQHTAEGQGQQQGEDNKDFQRAVLPSATAAREQLRLQMMKLSSFFLRTRPISVAPAISNGGMVKHLLFIYFDIL